MGATSIQLIRNATLKVKYADKIFLLDPMLSEKHSLRSFVVPDQQLNPTLDLPLPLSEIISDIDAVLLTHSHPDHFDNAAIKNLPKDISFFNQPADEKVVAKAGFQHAITIDSNYNYNGITIVRTSGKHGPDNLLEMLGEVSGFILQAEDHPTIYFIGDCIWDQEIEGYIDQYRPDIIITNSGGALFRGGNERILMDVDETLLVAKKAPNATIIAVHLQALDHCTVTRQQLNEAAIHENVTILTPADGQILELGA
ncbi:MAG: MBL fold metallo-hydrolase [Cytophagales bacterium]|nr:MBL fold metallo-hydrolase [Cytophagales bacterium]